MNNRIYLYRFLGIFDMPSPEFDALYERVHALIMRLAADGYAERLTRDLLGYFIDFDTEEEAVFFKLKYL